MVEIRTNKRKKKDNLTKQKKKKKVVKYKVRVSFGIEVRVGMP